MATENATEHHTTANEEEPVIAMDWQSGDSDNNGSDNSELRSRPVQRGRRYNEVEGSGVHS
jgi:hypothetical protein